MKFLLFVSFLCSFGPVLTVYILSTFQYTKCLHPICLTIPTPQQTSNSLIYITFPKLPCGCNQPIRARVSACRPMGSGQCPLRRLPEKSEHCPPQPPGRIFPETLTRVVSMAQCDLHMKDLDRRLPGTLGTSEGVVCECFPNTSGWAPWRHRTM